LITDYASLQATVAQWSPRADLAASIPTAIALAEAQINRTIRNRQQEQRTTATLTEFIALQTDYIEVRDVMIQTSTGNKKLDMLSPAQLNDLDRLWAGGTGEPAAFAIVGNQYKVAPSPDQSYTVEMVYVKKVPALTGAATTNWFLTDHPDCYLVGTQYHLLRIAKDPEAAGYLTLFINLLEDVNRMDRRQRWSGPPMAIRPA
jgi:hypothetical protein